MLEQAPVEELPVPVDPCARTAIIDVTIAGDLRERHACDDQIYQNSWKNEACAQWTEATVQTRIGCSKDDRIVYGYPLQ